MLKNYVVWLLSVACLAIISGPRNFSASPVHHSPADLDYDGNELANQTQSPMLAILRIFNIAACDGEMIHLKCDTRTVVHPLHALYGRLVDDRSKQCKSTVPLTRSSPKTYDPKAIHAAIHKSHKKHRANDDDHEDGHSITSPGCQEAGRLRYLFMRHVDEVCHEKNECEILLTPQSLRINTDPCPQREKYGEIFYKCRPNTFLNKVACDAGQIKLSCNPNDRIVVFSALYGAEPEGVPQCPRFMNSTAVDEVCEAPDMLNYVTNECHGRRACWLDARAQKYGRDLVCGDRVYLRVSYTCMSKDFLNEANFDDAEVSTAAADPSTLTNSILDSTHGPTSVVNVDGEKPKRPGDKKSEEDENLKIVHLSYDNSNRARSERGEYPLFTNPKNLSREVLLALADANSPLTRLANGEMDPKLEAEIRALELSCNCTLLPPSLQMVGFISEWMSALNFVRRNQERFVLYILVSFFASMIIFLAVLAGKLHFQKKIASRKVRDERSTRVVRPFATFGDSDEEGNGENAGLGLIGDGGHDSDGDGDDNGRFNEMVELHAMPMPNHQTIYGSTGAGGSDIYQRTTLLHPSHQRSGEAIIYEESSFGTPKLPSINQHICQVHHPTSPQPVPVLSLDGPTPGPVIYSALKKTVPLETKIADIDWSNAEVISSNGPISSLMATPSGEDLNDEPLPPPPVSAYMSITDDSGSTMTSLVSPSGSNSATYPSTTLYTLEPMATGEQLYGTKQPQTPKIPKTSTFPLKGILVNRLDGQHHASNSASRPVTFNLEQKQQPKVLYQIHLDSPDIPNIVAPEPTYPMLGTPTYESFVTGTVRRNEPSSVNSAIVTGGNRFIF